MLKTKKRYCRPWVGVIYTFVDKDGFEFLPDKSVGDGVHATKLRGVARQGGLLGIFRVKEELSTRYFKKRMHMAVMGIFI